MSLLSEGKRGRYSYEMKARHSASSGSTVPTTTASVTPQEIPTRGQNCSLSTVSVTPQKITTGGQNCSLPDTETTVESLGTISNSQSRHGNVLGLIDTQVSMPTEELQLLDLNEIERDLAKLNENTQDSLQLNELDLNENGQDLLQEAWAFCLELEKNETVYNDSLNPPESNNVFTQASNHGSETKLLGVGAEGTVLGMNQAVSTEHPSECSLADSSHSNRFTTEAQTEGTINCGRSPSGLGTRFTTEDQTGGPMNRARIPPSFSTRSISASEDSDSESEPQCFPASPETKAGNPGDSTDYLSAIFERNRNRQRTETEEELDMLISKASARMDERFNLFMMQKPKQGGGSDTTAETQGRRCSGIEQPKGSGSDGKWPMTRRNPESS